MAKKKLRKMHNDQGNVRVTKKIHVEDVNGNKAVLKATVIGIDTSRIRKEQSHGIEENEIDELGFAGKIVRPPLSQFELSILSEFSSELGPNIEQMSTAIEGFGQRIIQRKMTKARIKKYASQIEMEKRWIETHIIKHPNPDGGLRRLRKLLAKDKEQTGNSYVELVPSIKANRYSCYNRIEAGTMWITKANPIFTRITQFYVNSNLHIKKKTFLKRLRLYMQRVGRKQVFFKEFRDPRSIDSRNGEVLRIRSNAKGEKIPVDKDNKEVSKKFLAREVYHQKIPTARKTPYGLPRFTGNIIGIKGSRSSEESNILTLQNNNVPSMAVMISGGMLTDGSVKRIEEFVDTSIKGDLNYSKFLILEGESAHDSLSGAGSMKIEIKPLTNDQHTDALWSQYDDKNNNKTRRSFRQPPILVGDTANLSRATAQESERLGEKYVYNPEREELDEDWNNIIVQQGIRFHTIKTNSPNVTNDEDLVKIISNAEKTGGMTPRIARFILEDILNRELPPIEEDDPDFNPDIPFSVSLGKLARGMARSNPEGTLAPGQNEADKGKDNNDKKTASEFINELHESLDPMNQIENNFLKSLHGGMEDILDIEAFGESKKDYFKDA